MMASASKMFAFVTVLLAGMSASIYAQDTCDRFNADCGCCCFVSITADLIELMPGLYACTHPNYGLLPCCNPNSDEEPPLPPPLYSYSPTHSPTQMPTETVTTTPPVVDTTVTMDSLDFGATTDDSINRGGNVDTTDDANRFGENGGYSNGGGGGGYGNGGGRGGGGGRHHGHSGKSKKEKKKGKKNKTAKLSRDTTQDTRQRSALNAPAMVAGLMVFVAVGYVAVLRKKKRDVANESKATLIDDGELGPLDKPPVSLNPTFEMRCVTPEPDTAMSDHRVCNDIVNAAPRRANGLPQLANVLRGLPSQATRYLPTAPTYGSVSKTMGKFAAAPSKAFKSFTANRALGKRLRPLPTVPQQSELLLSVATTPKMTPATPGMDFSVMQTYA